MMPSPNPDDFDVEAVPVRTDENGPARSRRPASPGHCLECGAALVGRFCVRCGQEDRDPEPPAGLLLWEMVIDALGADAATWRSLRLLLTRPGALTAQYLEGKRRRHLPPLRLYLLASIPFLALAVYTPAGQGMIRIDAPTELAGQAEAFRETFFDVWPWFLIVMAPLFAGVWAVILWGVRATFTRHLVFTLHLHAFGFLAVAAALLAWFLPGPHLPTILAFAALLAPVAYLPFALRRAYGISWGASFAALTAGLFLGTLLAAAASYWAWQTTFLLMR